jgi:hypothetical protein
VGHGKGDRLEIRNRQDGFARDMAAPDADVCQVPDLRSVHEAMQKIYRESFRMWLFCNTNCQIFWTVLGQKEFP